MQLINLTTKQPEDVQDLADASARIASGQYGVYGDDIYPVFDPNGAPTKIKGDDLQRALNEGWSLKQTTLDDPITNEEESAKYDKLNAQAAVLGAMRGLSFGLSDLALTKMYGIDPEHIRKLRQYNSTVSGLSEIGGAVAPIIASGGTGLVGRAAAKSLPSLLNKVGAFTTAKTAAGIGRVAGIAPEATTMGKYLAGLGGKAIGSAVEASAYGAGEYLTEQALKDPGMQGESLMAHMGKSALTGGVLGAVIPAGIDAFGIARRKIPDMIDWAAKSTRVMSGIKPDIIEAYMKDPLKYEGVKSAEDIAEELTGRFKHFDDLVTSKQIDLDDAKAALQTLKGKFQDYSKELPVLIRDSEKRVDDALKMLRSSAEKELIPESIIQDVDKIAKGTKLKRDQLSKESYDILGNYENPENYKLNLDNLIRTVEVLPQKEEYKLFYKGGKPSPIGDSQKKLLKFHKSLINDLNEFRSNYSNELDFPEIKKLVQAVDQNLKDAKWGEMGTMEHQLLKDLRYYLREKLSFVPGYDTKMSQVEDATILYNNLRNKFFGKQLKDSKIKEKLYGIINDNRNLKYNEDLKNLVNASAIIDDQYRPKENIVDQITGMLAEKEFIKKTGPYTAQIERSRLEESPALSKLYKEYKDLLFDKENLDRIKNPKYISRLDEAVEEKIFGKLSSKETMEARDMDVALAESALKKAERDRKVFSPYEDFYKTVPKVISASHQSPEKIKALFKKASDLSDTDFVKFVEELRVQTAFDNAFTHGSRQVNLYAKLGDALMSKGAAAGAAIGGVGAGAIGAAMGAVMGAFMDFYGPAVTKRILIGLSKLKNNFTLKDYRQAIIDNLPPSSKQYLENSVKVLGRVEKDTNKTVNMIDRSVSDYLTRPISATAVAGTKYFTDDREFENIKERTQAYIDNRDQINNGFYDDNQALVDIAPNTMDSYFATYNRAIDFLDSKLPKGNPNDIFGDSKPTKVDMVKFNEYLNYVENPLSILQEFKNGNISQLGIETVKNVYHSIYSKVVEQITAMLADPKVAKKIPMEKRLQMKRLFGLDFYPQFDARLFSSLQKNNSVKEQQQAEEAQQMNKLASKQGKRTQTDMNRIMNKQA